MGNENDPRKKQSLGVVFTLATSTRGTEDPTGHRSLTEG
jgi:hypothetical protein